MGTRLTDKALDHLKEQPELITKVCHFAGINSLYASQAILRKSRALATWKAVEAIANSMKVKPEAILVED